MTTNSNEILSRDLPDGAIQVIERFHPLVEEFVSFGSSVISSDIKKTIISDEDIAPIMLLRHFIETLDGIAILIQKGNAESSKILLRALFETMLQIQYLFEKDTQKRCYSYLVADLRRQIKAAKKFAPNTNESEVMSDTSKNEGLHISPNESQQIEVIEFIKSKEEVLGVSHLAPINSEFEVYRSRTKKNSQWYSLDKGPTSIAALSKYLKHETVYEILYRKWSGSVHGTDIYLGKMSSENNEARIQIAQLRSVVDLPNVVLYSALFTFKVYRLYVSNRLKEKIKDYETWYLSNREWVAKLNAIKIRVA